MAQPSIQPHQIATQNFDTGDNIIINGSMDIWQRNTSFGFATASANTRITDRYKCFHGATTGVGPFFTVSRDTDVPNASNGLDGDTYNYSMKIDVDQVNGGGLQAGDIFSVRQFVEGYFGRQVYGKTCTFSFWIKTNKLGTYSIRVITNDQVYLREISVTTTNWTQYFVTFPMNASLFDTNSSLEKYTIGSLFAVGITLMTGTTGQAAANTWVDASVTNKWGTANQVHFGDNVANVFRTTGWKFVVGDYANGDILFRPQRNYLEELALCKRYYEKSYNINVVPGTPGFSPAGYENFRLTELNSNIDRTAQWTILFSTQKREMPSCVTYSTQTGVSGKIWDQVNVEDINGVPIIGETGMVIGGNMNTTTETDVNMSFHWTADADY